MDKVFDLLKLLLYGLITVFVMLFFITSLIDYVIYYNLGLSEVNNNTLIEILVEVAICAFLIYRMFRIIKKNRCPNCHKCFSLKFQGKQLIDSTQISVKTTVNSFNTSGKLTGTQEQYIPGTRNKYMYIYGCSRCGRQCSITKTEDEANI